MWRMVLMGRHQEVFESKTFILCSACYTCSLRCPRGLPLTEVMANLKQVAAKQNMARYKSSILFYKNFVNSIRRHGRVNEMEFMTLYFMGMKNPMLPLNFTRLGLRLMDKRKIPLEVPRFSNFPKPLEPIFKKVEEMEAR
jgi:heterodisulfide reductase subunit C